MIMTDYQKLKKCFDEIGIEYEETSNFSIKFIQIENDVCDILQFIFEANGKYIERQ